MISCDFEKDSMPGNKWKTYRLLLWPFYKDRWPVDLARVSKVEFEARTVSQFDTDLLHVYRSGVGLRHVLCSD